MENQPNTNRINRLMDRLNLQLAQRRKNRRTPKLGQKKEQLQHASLICKLFKKTLKIKLTSKFGNKEMIMDKFMVLENFIITPKDQFIDVSNIEEINFV
jgi:hypothetical protein